MELFLRTELTETDTQWSNKPRPLKRIKNKNVSTIPPKCLKVTRDRFLVRFQPSVFIMIDKRVLSAHLQEECCNVKPQFSEMIDTDLTSLHSDINIVGIIRQRRR